MKWISIAFLAVFTCAAQDVAAKMNEFLEAHAKVRGFMGTVLVAKGGKTILEKGYGFANVELKVPNTPANKFRLGSITKQFTAVAIMQLEERGKLNTTDLACKYLDPCPEAWKAVTIHHLLTHTSGIPSYTNTPLFATPKFMRMPLSPLDVVMLTKEKPLEFQPGEGWAYDNTGYVLLGYIIEKASGRNYADYLKEHVFTPLDMNDSGYDDTRAVLPGRAAGYDRNANGYRNADYLDMSLPHAAGSLYSTVGDLYRWDRALYTEKVVNKKMYAQMTTPVKHDYGYGLMLQPIAKHKQVGHGGGINGFSTCMNRFPEDDAVVIVLSNVVSANACGVGAGLAAMMFGQQVDLPQNYKEISLDPKVLELYKGKYNDGTRDIVVSVEDDRLYVQPTGQPKLHAYAYSQHQFFFKFADVTFDFTTLDGARATQVILSQGGQKTTAKRVE